MRRKSSRKKTAEKERRSLVVREINSISKLKFEEYIGSSVTVFIGGGNAAGNGFTGVLVEHTSTYIRLLLLSKDPLLCSRENECTENKNPLLCMFCPFNRNKTMASMAEIFIESIVAFVHNGFNSPQR